MIKLLIIGSGGHAKCVIDAIEKKEEYEIVGLIDDFKEVGSKVLSYKILGNIEDIPFIANEHGATHIFLAVGNNYDRYLIYNTLSGSGLNYISVIHPETIISKDVHIGVGSFINAGAIINSGSYIGEQCVINTGAIVEHDNVINDFASLAPSVVTGGKVFVGKFSFIGMNATIKNKITIGEHTVIGCSSNVIDFMGAYKTCYGNPCKEIADRNKTDNYI